MERLDEFRQYYNHTIFPELMRLERKRKRLLYLLGLSSLLIIGIITLEVYFDIFLITMVLIVPVTAYGLFLAYRFQRFVATFKPQVVNLVLDFIGERQFSYEAKRSIPKSSFIASKIFSSAAPYYKGEDFISGKIENIDFEMCELNVREFSKVRDRLNYVFKGIYLVATFDRNFTGSILILPSKFKQYLTRSIKVFHKMGAEQVEQNSEAFEEIFMTYATPETYLSNILSKDIQTSILEAHHETGKEIYISFLQNKMYVAVAEPRDILEPFILSSNVSFELVREFFEDIQLVLSIVQDFERNH